MPERSEVVEPDFIEEIRKQGPSVGLFQDTPYDQDDREADDIYESVDERIDSRRMRRRKVKMLEELKKARQDRPKISDQFADLKAGLQNMSDAEWEMIPDIGDYSLKFTINTVLIKLTSDAEIGDIKKACLLLRSVTMTNPKHGPGWITATRLKEVAGKIVQARKIIAQGKPGERQDDPRESRALAPSAHVWMKSVLLEREYGESPEVEENLLKEGIKLYPDFAKLYVMAGQFYEAQSPPTLDMARSSGRVHLSPVSQSSV